MRFRLTLVAVLVIFAASVCAQTKFTLTGVATPEPVSPVIIDVDYKGPAPDKTSAYMAEGNWKVKWTLAPDASATAVQVYAVSTYATGDKILLRVRGSLPADVRAVYWTVLFSPDDSVPL